jgi:catechol 2,3-dioxygenase-like lactoylglutathione lyase family enzyme
MTKSPRFGFAIEYVSDVATARDFYVNTLGLKVEREHPTFVQFDRFAIASDQPLEGDGSQPELYWLVDDAQAALAEISRTGEISLPLTHQPFGDVFGVKDPTGRTLFLLQLAQNRPSQAVG